MAPLPPVEGRSLRAVGARRAHPPAPSSAELVATLRRLAAAGEGLVALFDAGSIAGERHLYSAWAHLGRSRSRGESRLRDRGAELALYVAGDDQLPRALAKVGVAPQTEEFVLVVEKPRELEGLLGEFGLVADPAVYPRALGASVLERLGITEVERGVVPEAGWEGLVLERVAFVDLAPARSGAKPAEKH
ncbi:MAG: hypothetical protein L3K09_03665 [Thermoplasmata archaeon]|nr:hypothetical protein [Thermoplasmata archaeon]